MYPLAKLMARYTIGLVHNMTYLIEPMAYNRSDFESYSTSHLTIQARTPSLTDPF